MTTGTDLTARAFEIAYRAHAGQTDKNGRAYITHPMRVAARFDDPGAQAVALLHDVVEDTELTVPRLIELGVPPHITFAVGELTQRKGRETHREYIQRVASHTSNRFIIPVKLADIDDNRDPARQGPETAGLLRRYEEANAVLRPVFWRMCERSVDGFVPNLWTIQ